jgi:hypothetical protein
VAELTLKSLEARVLSLEAWRARMEALRPRPAHFPDGKPKGKPRKVVPRD